MRCWWCVALVVLALGASGCGAPIGGAVQPAETIGDDTAQARTATTDATPAPREPAPQLIIEPQPAPQSGQVQVSGNGFGGGELVVILAAAAVNSDSDLLPLGNATTAADGSFQPVTLPLPDQLQSGAHALQAVGQTSARRSAGTLWIRAPQPWIVMDNYDTPQYGDLGLIAGGFEPMDQVQVSLEPTTGASGSGVNLEMLTTDQAGNAVWSHVTLPRLSAGTYNLVLRGQASAAELHREVHVKPLKPLVELSPWAGPPGVPVQFNVKGFAPGERIHISRPAVLIRR